METDRDGNGNEFPPVFALIAAELKVQSSSWINIRDRWRVLDSLQPSAVLCWSECLVWLESIGVSDKREQYLQWNGNKQRSLFEYMMPRSSDALRPSIVLSTEVIKLIRMCRSTNFPYRAEKSRKETATSWEIVGRVGEKTRCGNCVTKLRQMRVQLWHEDQTMSWAVQPRPAPTNKTFFKQRRAKMFSIHAGMQIGWRLNGGAVLNGFPAKLGN